MLISLIKIKTNKETKEEEEIALNINSDDILCLYKDRKGSFLVTKRGIMHKVKHNINDLAIYLGF